MTLSTRREVLMGAAAFGVAAATAEWTTAASAKILASPTPGAPLSYVHPELRAAAMRLDATPPSFRLTDSLLPSLRPMMAARAATPLPDVSVSERRIKRTPSPGEVLVYVINSKPGTARPVILHMHGGGFIMGSAKSSVRSLQEMAVKLDCVIVTVDYRLAPETRWAGSIEDNYSALGWVHGNAENLGIDRSKIAIMGESAGGGHAALLAITARKRAEYPIIFQSLIYPMLDDRTGSARTSPSYIGHYVWRTPDNVYGWRSFLGQEPGTARVPFDAVPARTQDLSGLPPTFIGVGSIDLFVDEDVDYARRLIGAGIATECVVVPGAFHGFDNSAPESSIAKQFTEAKLNAFRRAFTRKAAA